MSSKYKLRAECRLDVLELRLALAAAATGWQVARLTIKNGRGADVPVPDVEATFACALPFETLQDVCASIQDGHVMAETVAPADKYTGERVQRKEGVR